MVARACLRYGKGFDGFDAIPMQSEVKVECGNPRMRIRRTEILLVLDMPISRCLLPYRGAGPVCIRMGAKNGLAERKHLGKMSGQRYGDEETLLGICIGLSAIRLGVVIAARMKPI